MPHHLTLHHGGQSHREPTARDHDEVNTTTGPHPMPPPPPLGLLTPPRKGRSASPNGEVIVVRMNNAVDSVEGAPRSVEIDLRGADPLPGTVRMPPTPRGHRATYDRGGGDRQPMTAHLPCVVDEIQLARADLASDRHLWKMLGTTTHRNRPVIAACGDGPPLT
jgi:hypothetical protein